MKIIVCSILFFIFFKLNSLALTEQRYSLKGMACYDSIPQFVCLSDSITETKKKGGLIHFVGKVIDFLSDFDSTYVAPNYYSLATMIQGTSTLQSYRITAEDAGGKKQSIRLKSPASFRAGPYFGWGPIFLGYTFDIAKVGTDEKKTELNFSFYTPIAGVDFLYVKNLGDFKITKLSGFSQAVSSKFKNYKFSGMKATTKAVNVYYIFNYKKFSYPAAFSQSTVQLRSCGSWKLGFQYSQQNIAFDDQILPDEIKNDLVENLKFRELNYIDYSINLGYAYNWVFARNWLLSLSVSPAIGLKKAKGEKFWSDKEPIKNYVRNFSIDVGTRSALVWNNSRFFAGLSSVSHMYGFRKNKLNLTNSYYYFYVYFGFNFLKKKKFK